MHWIQVKIRDKVVLPLMDINRIFACRQLSILVKKAFFPRKYSWLELPKELIYHSLMFKWL